MVIVENGTHAVVVAATASFWSLEFWGSITNLIGVLILGMAVPVGKWLIKKRADTLSEARKKEDDRIAAICKEFTEPMMKQLQDISAKVNYMDDVFRNNLNFGGDDHHNDDNRGGGPFSRDHRPGSSSGQKVRPRGRRFDAYNSNISGNDSNRDLREDDYNADLR